MIERVNTIHLLYFATSKNSQLEERKVWRWRMVERQEAIQYSIFDRLYRKQALWKKSKELLRPSSLLPLFLPATSETGRRVRRAITFSHQTEFTSYQSPSPHSTMRLHTYTQCPYRIKLEHSISMLLPSYDTASSHCYLSLQSHDSPRDDGYFSHRRQRTLWKKQNFPCFALKRRQTDYGIRPALLPYFQILWRNILQHPHKQPKTYTAVTVYPGYFKIVYAFGRVDGRDGRCGTAYSLERALQETA